jgi:hypothetical protein
MVSLVMLTKVLFIKMPIRFRVVEWFIKIIDPDKETMDASNPIGVTLANTI